ncbi:MAG: histidine phosphatase family protein [Candidatus Moranbacteria bacterium CG_4_9_14_3_um_filter_40_7]|nr:MAG: histidine phosphatase family protein [Candidatus Moranbacteria bacterium CG_4_9_14_3_um_filter_40_7]
MKKIFVIRHGETDSNKEGRYLGRTDESLNAIGISQAKKLAEKTSNLDIEIIYCSPLKRATETTEFIKTNHACEVVIDKHFIERSVGIYEGLTKEEAKNKYPDLYAKNITRIFNDAPPNGETINEVIKRVFAALNEIKNQNDFSNILISTHGFIAKVINKYFNPQISEQDFFDFSLTNAEVKTYKSDD